MRNGQVVRWVTLGILLVTAGCNKTGTSTDATNSGTASNAPAAPAPAPVAPPVVVPAGTSLTVTVDQTVGTKQNQSGDHFEASLAEPVTVEGNQVLPSGAKIRGTVTEAQSAGHLKGGATLSLTLDSITVRGERYSIATSTYVEKGKARGKRTAIGAGGGAAVGAIIGALAGGGKGAAIGAGAGAGAGTAGAAYTGDRDVSISAETRLHFKLTKSLFVGK